MWWLSRVGLFLSSYAPLAVIFGVRTSPKGYWHCETFRSTAVFKSAPPWWFLAAALGIAYLCFALHQAKKNTEDRQRFENVEDQGSQVTGYLATYLLPFTMSTTPGVRDYVAYAVFFIIVFLIFLRSDMALVNPTLYLIGYGIYRGEWVRGPEGNVSVLILSRQKPSGDEYAVDLSGVFVVGKSPAASGG